MPYIARCAEVNVLVSFQKPVYCRQWNYQIKKIYVRTSHLTQAWSKEMCRFFSKTFSWIGLVDLEQQFYVIIFPQKNNQVEDNFKILKGDQNLDFRTLVLQRLILLTQRVTQVYIWIVLGYRNLCFELFALFFDTDAWSSPIKSFPWTALCIKSTHISSLSWLTSQSIRINRMRTHTNKVYFTVSLNRLSCQFAEIWATQFWVFFSF